MMITKGQYARASVFAAAGAILALVAAVILVAVWIPVINPGMFRVQTGKPSYPTRVYVVGTILCVGLIALGKIGSDRSLKTVKQYKEQNRKEDGPKRVAGSD